MYHGIEARPGVRETRRLRASDESAHCDMNRMPIALFSQRSKAEPLQQRLRQAGLAGEIRDEPLLANLWFVSRRGCGVQVEVPAEEFERAEQLLQQWEKTSELLREAIRCPECQSLRIDYPQYARNSLLTNLALGLMAEVGLLEKDYYCQDCHFTWPKQGAKPRRNRPHEAPYYFIEGVEQTRANQPQPEKKGTEGEHREAA